MGERQIGSLLARSTTIFIFLWYLDEQFMQHNTVAKAAK